MIRHFTVTLDGTTQRLSDAEAVTNPPIGQNDPLFAYIAFQIDDGAANPAFPRVADATFAVQS